MPIRIVLGRADCDKSSYIYEEIGQRIKKGRGRMYLIVPEQFTLGAEKNLMAHNHLPGLLGADVLSLKRLGYRVLSEQGGIAKAFVDQHGRQMLLQKSIRQVKKDLTVYQKSAGKLGFLSNMTDLISEMKQNGITPEMLKNDVFQDGRLLGQKLNDIHQIYQQFNALLGEDRMDDDDRSAFVCEKIAGTDFLERALIWVDGFHTFSIQDFKILKALVARCEMLTLTLTCDLSPDAKDRQVFSVPLATLKKMEEIAESLETEIKIIDLNREKVPEKNDLAHLERELYAYHKTPFKEVPEHVEMRQCRDLWDEAEWAARKITALVRDHGMHYQDIVVLTGALDVYGSILKRVFTAFKIPYFLDTVQAITENPLIEAILSALESIGKGMPYEAVFSYIKTGFAPVAKEECTDLENYILAFGIKGKSWSMPFTENTETIPYDLDKLNELRIKINEPLANLKQAMKTGRTFSRRTRALVEFLEAIDARGTIEKRTYWLENKRCYEHMAIDSQIWNILMEVFDQIAVIMGDELTSLEEYTEILKGGFASYTVGVIPGTEDAVAITDPLRSRSGQMKALIVLGVNEGILPQGGNAFNLLSDRERKRLTDEKLMLQEGNTFRQLQETYTIYTLFSKPSDYLYLSYATLDEEGNTLGFSPLIGQIQAVFPKIKIASDLNPLQEDEIEKIVGPEGTLPAYIEAVREGKSTNVFKAVQQWYDRAETYKYLCQKIHKAADYDGIDAYLHPGQAREIFDTPLTASISRLEKFRQCPFAHFVQYGLKPVNREMYTVEPPDIGSLLHQVIDEVYQECQKKQIAFSDMTAIEADSAVDRILDKLLPEVRHQVFYSSGQYQYLGRKIRRVGKKTIRVLMEQIRKGTFEFKYSEQHFTQMLELPNFGEHIKLKGIIDRIDLYREENGRFIKIIDYKSGSKEPDLTEFYYGLSLQLVVYMDAAMALIGEEELIPGGTFYFHIDDPLPEVMPFTKEMLADKINENFMLNGIYLDDSRFIQAVDKDEQSKILKLRSKNFKLNREEFDALIAYVRKTVISMAEAITGGEITVRPYKRKNQTGCDYCDYQGICQFDSTLGKACYDVIEETINRKAFFEKITEKGSKMHAVDQRAVTGD